MAIPLTKKHKNLIQMCVSEIESELKYASEIGCLANILLPLSDGGYDISVPVDIRYEFSRATVLEENGRIYIGVDLSKPCKITPTEDVYADEGYSLTEIIWDVAFGDNDMGYGKSDKGIKKLKKDLESMNDSVNTEYNGYIVKETEAFKSLKKCYDKYVRGLKVEILSKRSMTYGLSRDKKLFPIVVLNFDNDKFVRWGTSTEMEEYHMSLATKDEVRRTTRKTLDGYGQLRGNTGFKVISGGKQVNDVYVGI